jgi:hypothetical protein
MEKSHRAGLNDVAVFVRAAQFESVGRAARTLGSSFKCEKPIIAERYRARSGVIRMLFPVNAVLSATQQ